MLGPCREGRTEDDKISNSFLLSPCSTEMLFTWRASTTQEPPCCPPPASSPELSSLPLPCLGFAPQIVEYRPLWDTSSQLKHHHQPAVHRSLPPAFHLQASPFLASQEHESDPCCNPRQSVGQANRRGVQRWGWLQEHAFQLQHFLLPLLFYWPPFTCFPHQHKPL